MFHLVEPGGLVEYVGVARLIEQLPRIIVKRFRGDLVFKAHGLVYHSTLGSRVTKKEKTCLEDGRGGRTQRRRRRLL